MHDSQSRTPIRPFQLRLVLLSSLLVLAGCASGPQENLSLIPAETAQQTQKEGLFSQPLKWSEQRPGCTGECPTLRVDSLVFPGHARLSTLIDHALAAMTWIDAERPPPYDTLKNYQDYFWETAGPRDETDLIARTRYRNQHLTVVELTVSQYRTGMAHGMTGSQFLNWDNQSRSLLTLDELLRPGARPAFESALQAAHTHWLQTHQEAIEDAANFARMWPFSPSDNAALTDQGLVVKYQPYEIAPYAWGQPELLIPYSQLRDILRPAYLPPQP